ncbi:MAG TPA: hypothetical protein VJY63_05610 [Marinospirillum sp.]|uniref:hypothetical protein n=1 Tax=Marinospirillum sp. TaxID=2183934 RepID=UPI002B4724B5|nr:hypothetical protein [Marinospirillum sp.]HKM15383.1 hypothetical protein [Marinospirillum sp.]
MKLNRNLNTWLLLLALAVMVSRVLTPFSVPPIVVHDNGFIEVCSTQGGFERILLDAEGNQVESKQPLSHCPQCAAGTVIGLPERPFIVEQHLTVHQPSLSTITLLTHSPYTALPPPTRAPPLA